MKVLSINKVSPKRVYAVKTSTGTFIADGLFHHNCPGCNLFLHGNYGQYTLKMIDRYGRDGVDAKIAQKHQIVKRKAQDYLEIAETYKQKLKELENL